MIAVVELALLAPGKDQAAGRVRGIGPVQGGLEPLARLVIVLAVHGVPADRHGELRVALALGLLDRGLELLGADRVALVEGGLDRGVAPGDGTLGHRLAVGQRAGKGALGHGRALLGPLALDQVVEQAEILELLGDQDAGDPDVGIVASVDQDREHLARGLALARVPQRPAGGPGIVGRAAAEGIGAPLAQADDLQPVALLQRGCHLLADLAALDQVHKLGRRGPALMEVAQSLDLLARGGIVAALIGGPGPAGVDRVGRKAPRRRHPLQALHLALGGDQVAGLVGGPEPAHRAAALGIGDQVLDLRRRGDLQALVERLHGRDLAAGGGIVGALERSPGAGQVDRIGREAPGGRELLEDRHLALGGGEIAAAVGFPEPGIVHPGAIGTLRIEQVGRRGPARVLLLELLDLGVEPGIVVARGQEVEEAQPARAGHCGGDVGLLAGIGGGRSLDRGLLRPGLGWARCQDQRNERRTSQLQSARCHRPASANAISVSSAREAS